MITLRRYILRLKPWTALHVHEPVETMRASPVTSEAKLAWESLRFTADKVKMERGRHSGDDEISSPLHWVLLFLGVVCYLPRSKFR